MNDMVMLSLYLATSACMVGLLPSSASMTINVDVFLPSEFISSSIDACPTLSLAKAEQPLIEARLASALNWPTIGDDSAPADQPITDAIQVKFSYHDTRCSDVYGPIEAMNSYYGSRTASVCQNGTSPSARCRRDVVQLFYGPCCKYALSPVARYASVWNVPIVTPGGYASAFDNRTNFGTLTRTTLTYNQLAVFVLSLLTEFGYRRVSLLYHENIGSGRQYLGSSECYQVVNSISNAISRLRYAVEDSGDSSRPLFDHPHIDVFDETLFDMFSWHDILTGMRKHSNVIILCASPISVRKILLKLAEMNFDIGQLLFINIDLFSSRATLKKPWYDEADSADRNELARKVYESVLTITRQQPADTPEYQEFSRNVKQRLRDDYGVASDNVNQAETFIGGFYDAVQLYAVAINDTISSGNDPSNNTLITRQMANRTFHGITGTFNIDEHGARNSHFCLLDLNPNTTLFETVGFYNGATKQYVSLGKKIHWGNGRTSPPPDVTECDTHGCRVDQAYIPQYVIVIVVLSSLLLVVFFTSIYFRFRDRRYAAPLPRRVMV